MTRLGRRHIEQLPKILWYQSDVHTSVNASSISENFAWNNDGTIGDKLTSHRICILVESINKLDEENSNPINPFVQRSVSLEAFWHNMSGILGGRNYSLNTFKFVFCHCIALFSWIFLFCYFTSEHHRMSHVYLIGLRQSQNGVFHLDATD